MADYSITQLMKLCPAPSSVERGLKVVHVNQMRHCLVSDNFDMTGHGYEIHLLLKIFSG